MRLTRIEALRTLLLIAMGVVLLGGASRAAPHIAPPHEPGPFTVGVTTFSATMSAGRVARIQVYYPTLDPPNCQTNYTVLTDRLATRFSKTPEPAPRSVVIERLPARVVSMAGVTIPPAR